MFGFILSIILVLFIIAVPVSLGMLISFLADRDAKKED